MRAYELADLYENGNRKDVRDELAALSPLHAAAMVLAIFESLRGRQGFSAARAFRASVDAWAEATD